MLQIIDTERNNVPNKNTKFDIIALIELYFRRNPSPNFDIEKIDICLKMPLLMWYST
jgi:hypothetical protein